MCVCVHGCVRVLGPHMINASTHLTAHLQAATSFLLLSFTLSAPRDTRAMHSSADRVVPRSRDPTLFTETRLRCRGDSSIVDCLTLVAWDMGTDEDCARLTGTACSLGAGGGGVSLMRKERELERVRVQKNRVNWSTTQQWSINTAVFNNWSISMKYYFACIQK